MKKNNETLYNLKYLIFLNNIRGLKILEIFKKKKINFDVIITKKNLNKSILIPIKRLGIKFTLIENCKNLKKNLRKTFDIFILAGFPHKLSKENLKLPKIGTINLHAGPLPKYMGGSPLNWQIINGEKKIGISIIKANEEIDGGKILIKKFFDLKKDDNILIAHKKANYLFSKNIFKSIYNLISKKYLNKIGKKKYFKQRSAKDSEINFKEMTATNIVNLARSQYTLYTPAFFLIGKKKVFIKRAQKIKKNSKDRFKYFFKCKYNYIGIKNLDVLNLKN